MWSDPGVIITIITTFGLIMVALINRGGRKDAQEREETAEDQKQIGLARTELDESKAAKDEAKAEKDEAHDALTRALALRMVNCASCNGQQPTPAGAPRPPSSEELAELRQTAEEKAQAYQEMAAECQKNEKRLYAEMRRLYEKPRPKRKSFWARLFKRKE
jgi:hypothetical protein